MAFKLLHIPSAKYVNELLTDDKYTTYNTIDEIDLMFQAHSKYIIDDDDYLYPIIPALRRYCPDAKPIIRHEFEIIEVDDV